MSFPREMLLAISEFTGQEVFIFQEELDDHSGAFAIFRSWNVLKDKLRNFNVRNKYAHYSITKYGIDQFEYEPKFTENIFSGHNSMGEGAWKEDNGKYFKLYIANDFKWPESGNFFDEEEEEEEEEDQE